MHTTTRTGLRATPHDVQGVEVKKEAAPLFNVSAKKKKGVFFGGGGGSSQLFTYFFFSRAVLEPNPPRKAKDVCTTTSTPICLHYMLRYEIRKIRNF